MKATRSYVVRSPDYAPDLAWQPLSRDQRQKLAILAKQAWQRWGRGEDEKTWRHAQCIKAVGRRITEAGQRDFLRLRAHFLDLVGKPGVAMDVLMTAETEPHRIAIYKLKQECQKAGLHIGYAEAICRQQNKCALAEATAPQVWRTIFTVRNRARKKK